MAIDHVLWDEEEGVWFDYDAKTKEHRRMFYPSNLAPLYTRSYNYLQREYYALSAVAYLKSQNIDGFFGEFSTSSEQVAFCVDFAQTKVEKERKFIECVVCSPRVFSAFLGARGQGRMRRKVQKALCRTSWLKVASYENEIEWNRDKR